MKLIYQHDNMALVQSAKNILAINHIESFIKGEHGSTMSADFGIANIFHQLWIQDDQDYIKATNIINQQIDNPTHTADWTCKKCNELNDASFEICWNCQNEPENG